MRALWTRLFAAALVLGGCSAEEPTTAPEQVELFTLWSAPGETEALDELVRIHQARRPGAEVIITVESDFEQYNKRLEQRMASRTPPSTFQSNQGRRVLQWALYNGTNDDISRLTPLNALAQRQGFTNDFPEEVLSVNTFEDRLYAFRLSIIRQNMLYYNVAVFKEHGIEAENLRTLEDLLDACQTLQDAGVTPLAMGNRYKWVLDMILWEQLFPGQVGADYYTGFWRGEKDARDPEVDGALDALLELLPYFNEDHAELNWDDGMMRLFPEDGSEPAAMAPMGDWGNGFYVAQGKVADEDFGAIPFPGTKDVFVFSADVFPLVAGVANRDAAEEFLITVADAAAQTAFNEIKGSLPANKDADSSGFSLLQKKSFDDFVNIPRVSVVHGFKPNDVMADIWDVAADVASSGDKELLLNYLDANYAALSQIQR